jgi:hypothetical protein
MAAAVRLKGVCYDVGAEMGVNWRPNFDIYSVRRELQIIRDDLRCNAVKITAKDLGRLTAAAREAYQLGLEVWYCPALWDKSPDATLEYLTRAAASAEQVRSSGKGRMVFVAGGELTLFMKGIIPGGTFRKRLASPTFISIVKAGEHNKPLNEFLAKANERVRSVYHGEVTYASLLWEKVDWDIFDFVCVDHYRTSKMADKYIEMLEPSFHHGKPVVITEFGFATTRGGIGDGGMLLSSAGLEPGLINVKSQLLHYRLPVIGRFVKPHLNGTHARDEGRQASMLVEALELLDKAGVEGAFIMQFESQITPYSDDPRFDLDMASSSLVRYFEGGKKGTTYPDMAWEPKESFTAVAGYYAKN